MIHWCIGRRREGLARACFGWLTELYATNPWMQARSVDGASWIRDPHRGLEAFAGRTGFADT
ncbi:MAG: hypothetical protein ACF8AM_00850 [Rhodopirellula sp. JB055]|uniref:hypothetical protein n=1 Tax=Rhodopirellula sp. JB055 TaxID=3342846 RepID=UPI00370ABC5E